jgi:hypothetical protein
MRADIWLGVVTIFMAVLGGIVSAHAPTTLWHKIAYVSAFVVAGAISIWLVVRISNENAAASIELGTALKNLGISAASIANMTALNTQLQGQLLQQSDTIADLSKQTIATVTGGDSICYIDFEPALYDVGGMTVIRVGKYPLRGVSAQIMDQARTQAAVNNLLRTHPRNDASSEATANEIFRVQRESEVIQYIPDFATPTRFIGGYQMTKSDRQSFQILFRTFNGSWIERMEIREVNGKWSKAILIEPGEMGRKKFFRIDSNFPRIDGRLDIPNWPRPVNGRAEWDR